MNEVGKHLPRKVRADIQMELRSLLLDALDEKSEGSPSPKMAAEVLREFGHPEEIAAKYHSAEVLIGPRLFPTYRLVIAIVLSITGGLHLLGLGFSLWESNGAGFVDTTLNLIFSFGRTAILNAGIVTLIFAIIEKVGGNSLDFLQEKVKVWDPYQLPPVKDPNRINRAELLVGILFSLIFIAWLNFFPNWFGGADITHDDSGIFVFLTAEFIQQIPWLTASWLLDVVLKTVVLLQGRWNRVTRGLELAVGGFGLYVIYRIFSLEAISIVPFFATMARWSLIVVILIVAVDWVFKLFRLLLGPSFTPPVLIKSKMA